MSAVRHFLSKNFKFSATLKAHVPGRALTSSSGKSPEERYIQTSNVPTMHFQAGLFRLVIPKLEDTCMRYLSALKPVAQSESTYARTEQLVEDFKQGVGKELQVELVLKDKKNKHTSYISKPWFDMYLADRKSIVLNYNPFIAFKEDQDHITDQAMRAANFIWSAVRFRNALSEEKLKPEVFHLNPAKSDTSTYWNTMRWLPSSLSCYASVLWKAFPLDMSQYSRLFNTTRIPVLGGVDELVTHPVSCTHVLVMHRGHMYTLQAVQPDGQPVSSHTLYHQLQGILEDTTPPPEHQLGYLTSLNRDQWAGLRKEVERLNQEELLAVDSALFVLCLDDSTYSTPDTLSHAMLHNYGANRWFDKSVQLIVTQGGHAAINFEHAWGDGVAVLRFLEDLYKDKKQRFSSCNPTLEGVTKLEFNLSPQLTEAVEEAKGQVKERCKSLSVDTLEYHKYGKSFLKAKKLSPDGVLQLAIQIAYYRQFKRCVPTYESCSTAAFKHGRTETIRPASVATKQCAEAFEKSHDAGPKEMLELITHANTYHSKLVKEAAMGRGFDRHLFALKVLAEGQDLQVPLFQDPSYAHMNEIILSTSTLSSDAVLLGGFAPVSAGGYGVGYGMMDDWLGTQVTTYPTQNGAEFIETLEQVFNDIFSVLNGINFK